MADRVTITKFGVGRNTAANASQLSEGQSRDSLNLIHGNSLEAKSRRPIDRVWATRPNGAAGVFAAWQMKKGDGTLVRFAKQGDKLYSFTLTPTTALTQLKTGLDATHLPGVAVANGLSVIADWQAVNYYSDGTAAGTNALPATPTGEARGVDGAAAVGNTAAEIYYWYTAVDAYSGAESPPCAITELTTGSATITRSADKGCTISNVTLAFTTPLTTLNLYRTIAGSAQPYRVTTGLVVGSFPYSDTSLDTSLTTVSTVHDEDGNTSIEKPAAAKHVAWHRGRIFLANFAASGSNTPTRVRWSRPLEPTQFENTSTAAWDGSKNDGAGEVTGLISFRGSLVVFKERAIWVMNGDQDETTFTFFCAVTGVGCVAPRSIRKDGDNRILFLAAGGVYSFDLGSAVKVSGDIDDDLENLNIVNRADFFCAGIDPFNRQYHLSCSLAGVSTNTKTHSLNLDSGAWGRQELGMNVIVPTCYSDTSDESPITNATGLCKLYVGDTSGYLYETDSRAAVGDGVTSGTVSATVTLYAANVTTASAASFRIAGDTLKGLPLTLRRAADNSYETVAITSNTATAITHAAFSGTNPAVGDTIYVGAYQTTLSMGRYGGVATSATKRWVRICAGFEKESSFSYYLRLGYTLDGDTAPTASTEIDMSGGWRAALNVQRRAVGLSPYLDMIGPSLVWQIVLIEIDVVPFERRVPTRA